jgi:hypothetical protein
MNGPIKPRHRWYQFELRTMFVVVTAFAVLLGIAASREAPAEGVAIVVYGVALLGGLWFIRVADDNAIAAGCALSCAIGLFALAIIWWLIPEARE